MSSDKYVECQIIVENYDRVCFHNQDTGRDDFGNLYLAPICRKIAKFENLLRGKKLKKRQAFEEFGTLLYKCLFNKGVDNALGEIIKEIRESKETKNPKRYRLQLVFRGEANELAGLPWEFLYYPGSETRRGFFIVDDPHLVISRYISSASGRGNLNITEDSLKVLCVTSEPEEEGIDKVLPDLTIKVIENLKNSYLIDLEVLRNKNKQEVLAKINNIKPHILHYIGHGRFDSQEQVGEITLVNSAKKVEWVSDRTFGEFFSDFQPRLVILQACQGGEVDFTANYAGLAPQLTRNEIPAVIAMQYPLNNAVASFFSEAFYQALAKGESVDAAMQQGRRKIAREHPIDSEFYTNRDFGTPVLYMSARDGNIMPRPKPNKFDAEVLRNSPSELEKAMNTLFNSDELIYLLYSYGDVVYQELNGETQQEKVKTLISKLKAEKDTKDLVDKIKDFKPEYFT
ncbi:MAG: CHAT domain-containing protein [Nostoc sp. DedQUE08]|uniref:CHAT domain-containing protein n=1 Tax=unclassified Nostoc TaxID=2593658 RepID=UPI002AD33897|nr:MULTISPECIES: CHAT domain-containing protein [unclassified Nostoc]MDZ8030068.1 CHAT domain-containing protein [Nostoc sp. DedSLP04]MDZ8064958.1 CHAT domain-containing protein [Nostoc sp. DedQUE08]